MSNIFTYLVRDTGGIIPFNMGSGELIDPVKSQGLNLDDNGAVYAQNNGVIEHYHQGLPFNVHGRLVIASPSTPTRFDQSIPFNINNRVAIGGARSYVNQGLAYADGGALASTL